MKVLLIIPAHNEGRNLGYVLERVNQYRDRYDALVIDDASTDNTAQVAHEYRIPVVRLAANLGIGGAVQTGLRYAVENGYDAAVQIDGNGQHDPDWVESLLAPIAAGEADCVVGSRYMRNCPDTSYRTPLARRIGMIVSSAILSVIVGQRITDTTSGFRALNRCACEYFATEYPIDFPDAEALLMLHLAHYKIKEVPATMQLRRSGHSSTTLAESVLYPVRMMIGIAGALLKNLGRQP